MLTLPWLSYKNNSGNLTPANHPPAHMAELTQLTDRSLMLSLGKANLHLCIATFKFSHTLIICDKLPETDHLFSIDIPKRYSLSYCWDSDKQLFIQREGSFLLTPETGSSNIIQQ